MPYDPKKFASYPLKGIDRRLWEQVHTAATDKGLNLRIFILQALQEKLDRDREVAQ